MTPPPMTNQLLLGVPSAAVSELVSKDLALDVESGEVATDINQAPLTRWRPSIFNVSQMVLKTCILLSPPFWS